MVYFAPLIGAAALYATFVSARPMPDSAIDEAAVSAPNGIIISATSSADSSMMTGSPSSSDSSGSYGGSSGSGYGGSDSMSMGSGYGSSSNDMSGMSSMMMDSMMASSTMAYAPMSSSPPSYGSGSSSWGSSGYNSCVQQCVAQFGSPMGSYTPSTSMDSSNMGGSGGSNGATHTVIVAPTQGVLRYIPFALNASVGDTIMFQWGAKNHTVTKSSELTPCNKSADAPFVSGEHDAPFNFMQVVNDTSTTYFYCGTPGHCEKGMFGIINPPNAAGAATSVGGMMSNLTMSDSTGMMAAMSAYTSTQTSNNTAAANWGMNIDMSKMPDWSHQYIAQNVMYTQTFMAANPDIIDKSTGGVNLAAASGNPLMIPMDITKVAAATSNSTSGSTGNAAASPSTTGSSAPAASSPASAASNGAGSVTSSKALVGVMAVVVAFFAL